MKIVHACCCGLDIHKKTVVACLIRPHGPNETRTFGTMTEDLLALADWLQAAGCTHVAMESTGIYWKPVYNLLEGLFELVVVNPERLKGVKGRKTDVGDAQWLAELLQLGMLQGSFIPPIEQRELRDLTRYRLTLTQERARTINRLQKVLEDANIKLAAVASNIMGVSARAMLAALLAGESDPATLADLARKKLRDKRPELEKALRGKLKPHHQFLLAEQLDHIDYLEQAIERVSAQIEERLRPFEAEVALLDSIPGIDRLTAEVLLAEIGWDMRRFPTAQHLASWAGMCPGNNESAGKRISGKTRKGSPWLRQTLVEAAHGATNKRTSYLAAQYHRLVGRRGKKKAIVAVGHSILVIAYHVLSRHEPYQELGANYFDERQRSTTERRLVRRLENLGYEVSLKPKDGAVPIAA
jgi:transposase